MRWFVRWIAPIAIAMGHFAVLHGQGISMVRVDLAFAFAYAAGAWFAVARKGDL